MNIKQVEENVFRLAQRSKYDLEFIYDLLLAYGKPKVSITRLKKGTYNLSKSPDEIYWKKNLLFKYITEQDLHHTIDELSHDEKTLRHSPRFIIVTDYKQLLAVDTKTKETLDIKINEINKHFTFFLPWAGMEKSRHKNENLADRKAAERMARLYDEIRKDNPSTESDFIHSLNVFFSRLLFCFFADDTSVFKDGQFTDSIASHTQEDGTDLDGYIDELFASLDIEDKSSYPSHLKEFPYVNGGLFAKKLKSPKFSPQSRKIILECAELDWSQINPDIFGSMIQAVVHPGERESLGMHYTSVVNIMKVIEPLFLEGLYAEFDKRKDNIKQLKKLLHRVYAIKFFDPACGSGNFLIIAFKELRKLEHQILKRISELDLNRQSMFELSGIKLENFYGIEIDDFAHEIAILSLWLAKHQMNIEFYEMFGVQIDLVPLKDSGNIFCENAAQIDWSEVCEIGENDEIYLIGNPPYGGARKLSSIQKQDMKKVLGHIKGYSDVDYVFIWFYKGANYVRNKQNAQAAFVATNSVSQGQQVSLMWPSILTGNIEIGFAHLSFKWSNNARGNAGVICVIINLRNQVKNEKLLIDGSIKKTAKNINAYLVDADEVYISKRHNPISNLPKMNFGSMPNDGGNLTFSEHEYKNLILADPKLATLFKKYAGAKEFISGLSRRVLWANDDNSDIFRENELIKQRIEKVRKHRLRSKRPATRKLAKTPHLFAEIRHKNTHSVIIPEVSSERREYIPIGFLDSDTVISNKAFAIYDAEPYVFGLLISRMHMVWTKAVAGRLKNDINYSSTVVYNNWPTPVLSEKQKDLIAQHAFQVLGARENHSDKTLREMYDPDDMPDDLRQAHKDLDEVVDRCYRSRPFESDEDRLEYLFKLYEEMIKKEKETEYA